MLGPKFVNVGRLKSTDTLSFTYSSRITLHSFDEAIGLLHVQIIARVYHRLLHLRISGDCRLTIVLSD